jgi:hypothetical protein
VRLFGSCSARKKNRKDFKSSRPSFSAAPPKLNGELLDSDEIFEELRELIKERRRAKQKAVR